MSHAKSLLNPLSKDTLDYFDAQNRLLLVGPAGAAEHLGLWRREVGLAVLNAEKKVYARRVGEGTMRWEISARGFIRSGEDGLAALERIRRAFAFADVTIRGEPALLRLEEQRIHLTLFAVQEAASAPLILENADTGLLLLDKDELESLTQHTPELLTPGLVWLAAHSCWIWPEKQVRISRK